jgi:DNA mismatch repair protein MutS
MCGVPVHAADDYLQKLIAQGYRVAVCEQTEDPAEARKRGGKAVVRRAVTRLVTPGTITEDRLLEAGRSNYLAALVRIAGGNRYALAWVDISTGEFCLSESQEGGLTALLSSVEPREVLVADRLGDDTEVRAAVDAIRAALTPLAPAFFDGASADARLAAVFGVSTMQAFGNFSRAELAAAAALLAYVDKTQISKRPPIEPPKQFRSGDVMRLDAATRTNLELFRSISGARQSSLIAAIDRTRTAAGARLLADRIASPLCDPRKIADRLDAVQFFVEQATLRSSIRETLSATPDMLRALSRLGLDRGGPRDLDCIRQALEQARAIAEMLASLEDMDAVPAALRLKIEEPTITLCETLAAALANDLPLLKRDGGFVRQGYNSVLDESRSLRDESRRFVAGLQARYAEATGIRSLKIKHNNFLGYFVEVNAGQAPALKPDVFIHRQTMQSAMRFSTAELAELEQKIASAADRALAIEIEVFGALATQVAETEADIRAVARTLAEIDVASALAELAAVQNYERPKVDGSLAFAIRGGRHPVVEQALRAEGQTFVGNDCDLGARELADDELVAGRLWLLTGPNMAGKSTFLRQNALIAILAQAGSFVPAESAHIGVVDALFSRVGAADDLARGRSTFMVEMVETAAILNQAGPRSLVILDEIGRGTATFDGLSIAWAALEHLHDRNRCRTLFATHYHELTALSAKLDRFINATMKVKEWKGDVVFLHEVTPGAADRSYGIQVAKLAGLPSAVIQRAKQVLTSLEKSDRSRPKPMIDDLPLFAVKAEPEADPDEHPALAALDALNPDELSPKEALERLYELKTLRRKVD